MAYKHTIFFQAQTNASGDQVGSRVAGWSESFYHSSPLNKVGDEFDKLFNARLELLPSTSRIIGWRISDTTKQRGSEIHQEAVRGKWGKSTDFPSLALLARGRSSTGNMMNLILRGLPDEAAEEGELAKNSDLQTRFRKFAATLKNFFQIQRSLVGAVDIVSISNAGTVITRQDLVNNDPNKAVRILRTRSLFKTNPNGVYTIEARTTAKVFTLFNWQGGNCEGGTARMVATVESNYTDDLRIFRLIHRKVGRPIFQFVGRR